MSKGLSYLAAARPEAIGGLLQFYGKSAEALDEKTRFLISVVTKVATGTERGLRQYAPRAIQAGASKEELLDAVLMAFPAAGLTKVVDAVQILLEMDLLPSISKALSEETEKTEKAGQEISLGLLSEFKIGEMNTVSAQGKHYLVYKKMSESDAFKVYRAACPHAKGDLSKGTCEGSVVECPVHHFKFDLDSGKAINPKHPSLTEVHSTCRDGALWITGT